MRTSLAAALTALAVTGCTATAAAAPQHGRPWRVAYDGYGHVAASTHRRVVRITLQPARATSPADTHAALVLSRNRWRDLTVDIRIRTNRQLRRPHPNAWEVGWLLWHYTNDQHFYYIILKPNGWELGKEDPIYRGDQRYLATRTHPAFPTTRWDAARVQQRADLTQPRLPRRGVAARRLTRLALPLQQDGPDTVIVQGDTTAALAGALASFYQQAPVVHGEAGLRTGHIYSPFPEEANRRLPSQIT